MTLADANIEKSLKIKEIMSGKEAARKLNSMGLFINDKIKKVSDPSWGPILVQNLNNGSTKMAIGRDLANKIEVEYER